MMTPPAPIAAPHATRISRQALAWVVLLTIVAMGLRVVQAARLGCISRDGVHYVEFARQLAQEPAKWMRIHRSQPGFPALLLMSHAAVGHVLSSDAVMSWQRAGQGVSVLGGAAVVALVFFLTRRLFDERIGILAAGLACVWPQSVELSADVLTDMPHLALYLGALLCAGAGLRGRIGMLAASGLLAGLGYLVRQEALGALLASAAAWSLMDGGYSVKRRLGGLALMAAAFAVPVTPYVAITGDLLHKKSLRQLLEGGHIENPTTNTAAVSPRLRGGPAERPLAAEAGPVRDDEATAAGSSGRPAPPAPRFSAAGSVTGWTVPLVVAEEWARSGRYVISTLALVGLLWPMAPRSDSRLRWLIALAAGVHLVAIWLRGRSFGEVSGRYVVVLTAISLPWAAAGLSSIVAALSARGRALPAGLIVLACVLVLLEPLRVAPGDDQRHQREAGDWLRALSAPGEAVLSPTHLAQTCFYADRDRYWPAAASLNAMWRAVDRNAPRWWLDLSGLKRLAPEDVAFIISARQRWGGLRPVHETSTPDGRPLRLYRLERP